MKAFFKSIYPLIKFAVVVILLRIWFELIFKLITMKSNLFYVGLFLFIVTIGILLKKGKKKLDKWWEEEKKSIFDK